MEARGSLAETIRRDAERSLFRAKNGIRYVAGIGRPKVGQSPKDVVWTREKATLVRYRSDRRSHHPPLLLVPSIVSRAYILDLRPGQSVVQSLLEAGIDVFLIDWGVPAEVESANTMETYMDNYLPRAIAAAREATGDDEIDLLGYCFGGTLSLLCLAGHPEIPARSVAVMATPVDFSRIEGMIQAIRRGRLDVDDLIDHTGNIPPDTVYRGFSTLRPTTDIFKYANLWERLWNDDFMESYQALGQWMRDQVPFPGACARQLVDLLLRQNLLATGEVPFGGRWIRLADLTVPVLNIIAEHDHMVPPAASEPLRGLVGSADVRELRVEGGHVGLVVGRDARRTTIPGIIRFLKERSA
jgi:polyhydroxyalkanoate synthase